MREICEVLEIDQIEPTVGSSIPSIFFTEIAAALGVPTSGTMPTITRRIIESSHLPWKVEYASEHKPSGGGGTVTTLGLLALLDAVKVWKGEIAVSEILDREELDWQPPSDWMSLREECERVEMLQLYRPGASEFRETVLANYNFTCAITGTQTIQAIEAAHIVPYFGILSDVPSNGIALRVDIHRLFDSGLIGITYDPHNDRYITYVHGNISKDYGHLHGQEIYRPIDPRSQPSRSALEVNAERHRSLWVD